MSCCDLVKFWIAEGLVEERSDQVMEKTAEDYYQELIRRHLLEPHHSIVYQFKCGMHDMLKSLAQYLSKEESFCIDQESSNWDVSCRLRHLSIAETYGRISIPLQGTNPSRLRTLIVFRCPSQVKTNFFLRFKHLRVLRINGKELNRIPKSIGTLIQLRMLDLDNTSIQTLPESIGSLTNLLFLNLENCNLLHTLPRCTTQLCNLRHLNVTGASIISVPKGLGRLQNLTDVRGFPIAGNEDQNGWHLEELEGLSQLRTLWISKLQRARNVCPVLANKIYLKDVFLIFSKVIKSSGHMKILENKNCIEILEKLVPPPSIEHIRIINYSGQKLPTWISSSPSRDCLPNLQKLHLIGWSCCTTLPPLGLLPNLKDLRVRGASAIVRISSEFLGIRGQKGPNFPTVFPKLEHLIFGKMPNWEEWVQSSFEGEKSPPLKLIIMPCIKELVFENCPKLKALPKVLQQLKRVKDVIVRGTYDLRLIQDFPFECEKLLIENNRRLHTLSNLPGVKRLNVVHTQNLRHVSNLDSLEYISIVDYMSTEGLPKWLVALMEERKERKLENRLHLNLFCSTILFKRCMKDGADWPIIKCFSSASVYNRDKTASLEYIREPESYFASL